MWREDQENGGHEFPKMEIVDVPSMAGQCLGGATCVICGAVLPGRAAVRLRECQLRACRSCGSWTCFPRSSPPKQAALHDNADYFEHPYFKLRRVITPAHRRRCHDLFRRLSAALELSTLRGLRLLDIGCDTGLFLRTAQ